MRDGFYDDSCKGFVPESELEIITNSVERFAGRKLFPYNNHRVVKKDFDGSKWYTSSSQMLNKIINMWEPLMQSGFYTIDVLHHCELGNGTDRILATSLSTFKPTTTKTVKIYQPQVIQTGPRHWADGTYLLTLREGHTKLTLNRLPSDSYLGLKDIVSFSSNNEGNVQIVMRCSRHLG